ncbi:MAG: hypothetical protein ACM3RX_08000 [Methanococcaceae archaeon]
MIISAEIINQPISGEYQEIRYDCDCELRSNDWTWIRFTNNDYSEWCGSFPGFPINVEISDKNETILVMTYAALFQLDKSSGKVLNKELNSGYIQLTLSPSGEYILATPDKIDRVKGDIRTKVSIDSPIKMDFIEFRNWNNGKLTFICDEFLAWDRHFEMELDPTDWTLKIINAI